MSTRPPQATTTRRNKKERWDERRDHRQCLLLPMRDKAKGTALPWWTSNQPTANVMKFPTQQTTTSSQTTTTNSQTPYLNQSNNPTTTHGWHWTIAACHMPYSFLFSFLSPSLGFVSMSVNHVVNPFPYCEASASNKAPGLGNHKLTIGRFSSCALQRRGAFMARRIRWNSTQSVMTKKAVKAGALFGESNNKEQNQLSQPFEEASTGKPCCKSEFDLNVGQFLIDNVPC